MIRKIVTFPFRKSKELKEYGGYKCFFKGGLRYLYNLYLVKKYDLKSWHRNPIYWMSYRLEATKQINNIIEQGKKESLTIVEIGCGLGEILREVKKYNKNKNLNIYGFDIDKKVIDVAKKLGKEINFKVGTFDSVINIPEKTIDILIMISFLHCLSKKDIIKYFNTLMKNKYIRYIVLDERNHNFDKILNNYNLIYSKKFDNCIIKVYQINGDK